MPDLVMFEGLFTSIQQRSTLVQYISPIRLQGEKLEKKKVR